MNFRQKLTAIREFLWILILLGLILPSHSYAVLNCGEIFSARSTTLSIDSDLVLQGPLGTSRPSLRSDFQENSAALTYFQLGDAYHHLSQMDPLLFQHKIALPPPSGLCGPTCATNIITTMSAYRGMAPPGSNYEIAHYVVNEYSQVFGTDARRNTNPNELGLVIQGAVPALGLRVQETNVSSSKKLADLFRQDPSTLVLAQIYMEGLPYNHWMMILNIDTIENRIVISDPNRPNSIVATPYYDTGSTLRLQVFGNYGGSGTAYLLKTLIITSK